MLKKLFLLTLLAGIGYWIWSCKSCSPPKPPTIDFDEWWGPKHLKGQTDKSVKTFKIKWDEAMLKDLRSRLSSHKSLTPPLEGVNMEYGMNTDVLKKVINYWSQDYSFTEREKLLNSVPHFKTNIQGLDIHFIRVKPEVKKDVEVIPLILVHGWPGSVREFYDAIPLLTTPRSGHNFVFEVIVPSLPGYGYSSPAVRPGLNTAKIAVIFRNLMQRLGHRQYYVQGGDWGSAVVSAMSTLFPNEVLGHHTNMAFTLNKCSMTKTLIGSVLPSLYVEESLASRLYPLSNFFAFVLEEFGYFHLQATKPDTVGVGLTDSPAGLAAYISEKFIWWTQRGLKTFPKRPDLDSIIDNLMIYWTTNSITTSMRLYAEQYSKESRDMRIDEIPTSVPTWAIQAKYELIYLPPSMLKTKYPNLINTTVLDEGGHFLAMELPVELTDDVFKAVDAFRQWHLDKKGQKQEL